MRWNRAGRPLQGPGTIPKIIGYFKEHGRSTTAEIEEHLSCTKYETNVHQLRMILERTGLFELVGTTRKRSNRGHGTYSVNIWNLKEEYKCVNIMQD